MLFTNKLCKMGTKECSVLCSSENVLTVFFVNTGKAVKKNLTFANNSYTLSDAVSEIDAVEVATIGEGLNIVRIEENFIIT